MASNDTALFSPLKLGRYQLKHRIVHAPMTRMRSDKDGVPNDLMAEYYSQRATDGGFLVAGATFIGRHAGFYHNVPGIYSRDQIMGWKKITDQVHSKGGVIFLQIVHLGRVASSSLNEGNPPVSASAIAINGNSIYDEPYETPHALSVPEINEITQQFCQASLNALEAGFDGVEIHAAHGFLLDQFINSSSNKRTDAYGGSLENRGRFPLEVVDAIVNTIGADRTAIRFSPWAKLQDVEDETPYETYGTLIERIQEHHPGLAYVHMVEPRSDFYDDKNQETTHSLDPF